MAAAAAATVLVEVLTTAWRRHHGMMTNASTESCKVLGLPRQDVAMAAFKDRFGALRTLTPTATLQDSYEQAVRHATRLYDSEVSCCGSAPQASQGLHELRGDFQRQYDAAVLQNTALQKQEEERQLRVQREEAERRQREAERRQREAEEARRQVCA